MRLAFPPGQRFRNRTFDNNCISPLRKVLTYGFDTLHIESARKMNSVFLERPGLLVFGRNKAFIQSAEGIEEIKLFSKAVPIQISHDGGTEEAPIHAALHEIAIEPAGTCRCPQAHVNAPVPVIILPGGAHSAGVHLAGKADHP